MKELAYFTSSSLVWVVDQGNGWRLADPERWRLCSVALEHKFPANNAVSSMWGTGLRRCPTGNGIGVHQFT